MRLLLLGDLCKVRVERENVVVLAGDRVGTGLRHLVAEVRVVGVVGQLRLKDRLEVRVVVEGVGDGVVEEERRVLVDVIGHHLVQDAVVADEIAVQLLRTGVHREEAAVGQGEVVPSLL